MPKRYWDTCRTPDDSTHSDRPMRPRALSACPAAAALQTMFGSIGHCGGHNENPGNADYRGGNALRLYQQQQPPSPRENDRRRTGKLDHDGGLSRRNQTALRVIPEPERAGMLLRLAALPWAAGPLHGLRLHCMDFRP